MCMWIAIMSGCEPEIVAVEQQAEDLIEALD